MSLEQSAPSQGPDPVEEAIGTMLLRTSHLDLTILVHEHISEDTLRSEANRLGFSSYPTEIMLDQISFHDFKQIIRRHIATEILYEHARWCGYAGPSDSI